MAGDTFPEIAGLIASPVQVPLGSQLTLTATGVTASVGNAVSEVGFFRDVDRNGQLTAADGAAIGIDTDGSNAWSVSLPSTAAYGAGTQAFFAVAKDSTGAESQPVSTTVTILSPTRILDDGDSGYSVVSGTWNAGNGGFGSDHKFSWFSNGVVEWRFSNVVSGAYRVAATWTNASNRAAAAPYEIIDGTNSLANVLVNQKNAPAADATAGGRSFQNLGSFEIVNGELVVRLTNTTASSVSADAIRLEHVGPAQGASEIRVYDGSSELIDGTSTINLGSTFLGTEVPRTLTVKNVGTGTLALTQLTQAAMPAGYRLVSGYGSTTLAQGQSTTFTVALAAQAIGTAAGSLAIVNDDPDEASFDIQLTGVVNSSTVKDDDDPGYVIVSGTWQKSHSGFNNDHAFSWFNAGAVEWRFGNLLPGEYQVSATWTNASNRAVAAPYMITGGVNGAVTAVVNQRNAPVADASAGGRNFQHIGRLEVTSGGLVVRLTNTTASSLSADAIRLEYIRPLQTLPEIRVFDGATELFDAASTVNLGSTFYGTALLPKALTVTNAGAGNLALTQLTQAAMPAGVQLVSGFGSTTLSAGQSTTFQVRLAATSIGSVGGVLSIFHTDTDETPFEIALSGVVNNFKIIDDEDPEFAVVSSQAWSEGTGGYGSDHSFEVGATGGYADWTFSDLPAGQYQVSTTWVEGADRSTRVAYSGFDGGLDVGTGYVNQRVAPVAHMVIDSRSFQTLGSTSVLNGSLVVRMTNFSGDGRAIADAVRIEYLGPAQQVSEIRVFDGGTELVDAISTVNLGESFIGTPTTAKTLTIKNVGVADLVLTPLTQANMPEGITLVSSFANTTIARGQSATLQVQLAGASLGAVSGVLSIIHNDTNETPFEITLSGVVSSSRIIDDEDSGFVVVSGAWQETTGGFGDDHVVSSLADGAVEWRFTDLVSGRYRVSATWPQAATLSSSAPYTILGGSAGVASVFVDQTNAPRADASAEGRDFQELGSFHVFGDELVVRLTSAPGASVSADAIRLEYLGAPIPSEIASFSNGRLDIATSAGNDTVAIGTVNVGGIPFVVVNGQMVGAGVPAADVSSLVADLGEGDDTLDLSAIEPSTFTGLSAGAVTVHGGAGDDTIEGSPFADVLHGDEGDDTILGLGGNDTIDGGNGSDSLVGGDGDDTYLIGSPGDTGTDSIDEVANGGTDRVDLTGLSPLQRISAGSTDVQPVSNEQSLRFVNASTVETILGNRRSLGSEGIYTVPGDPGETTGITLRYGGNTTGGQTSVYFYEVDEDGYPLHPKFPDDPLIPAGEMIFNGDLPDPALPEGMFEAGTRLAFFIGGEDPESRVYSMPTMNAIDADVRRSSSDTGETIFTWKIPYWSEPNGSGSPPSIQFGELILGVGMLKANSNHNTAAGHGFVIVAADEPVVAEDGSTSLSFTFTNLWDYHGEDARLGPTPRTVETPLTVVFWEKDRSGYRRATAGVDYSGIPGGFGLHAIVIPAGEHSVTLTLPVINDQEVEGDESVDFAVLWPYVDIYTEPTPEFWEQGSSPYFPGWAWLDAPEKAYAVIVDDDKVDLDVDSDNSGQIDRTPTEEYKENKTNEPGKILAVGGARQPVQLAIGSGVTAELSVLSGADKVRFWGSQAGGAPIGYKVRPEGSSPVLDYDISGGSGSTTVITLWVDAIEPSEVAGDVVLKLEATGESASPDDNDTVRLTAVEPDLRVVGLEESEEESIGGLIAVNNNRDEDNFSATGEPLLDNEPDADHGHHIIGEQDTDLFPVQLHVMSVPVRPGVSWSLTFPEKLRVWRRDGDAYVEVKSDEPVSVADGTPSNAPVTVRELVVDLLVEGMDFSETARDLSLVAHLSLDGSGQGSDADTVRLTAPMLERVAWDPETGEVFAASDEVAASEFRPEASLSVERAQFDQDGNLVVDLVVRVSDVLSGLLDDAALRIQSFSLYANGQLLTTVTGLASEYVRSGPVPWQPHSFSGSTRITVTLPPDADGTWGGKPCVLRVETSPNAAGRVGWDLATVVTGLRRGTEFSPGMGNPAQAGGVWVGGTDATNGVMYYPVIELIEHQAGSPSGAAYPWIVRFRALDDGLAERATLLIDGIEQSLAPFTFSPTMHYVIKPDKSGPKILVLSSDTLSPAALQAITPRQIQPVQNGQKLEYRVIDTTGRPLTTVTVLAAVPENFSQLPEDTGGLNLPPPTVQNLGNLMAAYGAIYGADNVKLLEYYQAAGGLIEVRPVWSWFWGGMYSNVDEGDGIPRIWIDPELDLLQGAHYLAQSLVEMSGHVNIRNQIPGDDVDAFIAASKQGVKNGAGVVAAGAQLFINGIGIVSEPVDWILTIDELRQGNAYAAIGFIPFIAGRLTSAGKIIVKNGTKVFATFGKEAADAIAAALRITDDFSEQLRILVEGTTVAQRQKLLDAKILVPARVRMTKTQYLAKLRAILPPGNEFLNRQLADSAKTGWHLHHDLPWTFKDWFVVRGVDVNEPLAQRYVNATSSSNSPGIPRTRDFHQHWSRDFELEWWGWMTENPEATRAQILEQMGIMQGRYPAAGRATTR